MSNPMKYLAICGNVAAGKTMLAQALCNKLPLQLVQENIDDIPFLVDCYKDTSRWAFSTQVAFYVNSLTELIRMKEAGCVTFCMDYTVIAHHHVFTRYLRMKGYLSEREYGVCERLFECLVHFFAPPILLIYLKGPLEILLERIKSRGRKHEQRFTKQYLTELDDLFDAWIESYDRCPVLRVNAGEIDGRIEQAAGELAGKVQDYI